MHQCLYNTYTERKEIEKRKWSELLNFGSGYCGSERDEELEEEEKGGR